MGAAGRRDRRAPDQRARGARQPHAHQGPLLTSPLLAYILHISRIYLPYISLHLAYISLTLTKAEAYHNMIWAMASRGVPVGAVGVQALFDGEIDASTVKHRLDVLSEVHP